MTEIFVSVLVFGCLGCCLGFIVGIAFGYEVRAGRHSKRECRECRRRIIECGFTNDKIDYRVIKKGDEV